MSAQVRPRGATPRPRSDAAAKRSYHTSRVKGGGRRSYPPPEVGAVAERSYPTSKEQWLCRGRRADRSYSMFKVRRGGPEEIPHVQDKRNPSKTVGAARELQRAETIITETISLNP